jgi:hypothetical protein
VPFRFEDSKTPAGKPCLVIRASGMVELEDAKALEALIVPGARHHRGLVLSIVDRSTEYKPAARKYFATTQDKYGAMGVVVTSPIARAAINLMMRLTGQARAFRMFNTEAEALAWLDAWTPESA